MILLFMKEIYALYTVLNIYVCVYVCVYVHVYEYTYIFVCVCVCACAIHHRGAPNRIQSVPNLQGEEVAQHQHICQQICCYRPIQSDHHPFFNKIKHHFLHQLHIQEFIDIMQKFSCKM